MYKSASLEHRSRSGRGVCTGQKRFQWRHEKTRSVLGWGERVTMRLRTALLTARPLLSHRHRPTWSPTTLCCVQVQVSRLMFSGQSVTGSTQRCLASPDDFRGVKRFETAALDGDGWPGSGPGFFIPRITHPTPSPGHKHSTGLYVPYPCNL